MKFLHIFFKASLFLVCAFSFALCRKGENLFASVPLNNSEEIVENAKDLVLFEQTLQDRKPFFSFQAEEVTYDGKKNIFRGSQSILKFKENACLTCGLAEFDQTLRRGTFSKGIDGPYAIYQGKVDDRKGNQIPIEIKGKQICIESCEREFDISSEKEVFILYNHQYSATADRASYRCDQEAMEKGLAHLVSDNPSHPCQLSNDRGDSLQGEQIWIDVGKRQISVDCANGLLLLPNQTGSQIHFTAKTLKWDEEEGVIALADEVTISCDGFGIICSESAILEYCHSQHQAELARITIRGNVRMRNQFADLEGGSPLDQYALADLVTFDPSTRKVLLNAQKGKRVLFYDKANHMQVSAPALSITSGTKIGKESIKGIGDVRFTFAEQELDLLRKQFPKRI